MDILITQDQQDEIKDILKDVIKYDGITKASKIVNGLENLFKIFEITTPTDFLNLFNDLEVVKSNENPKYTLFRYVPGHNIMVLSKEYTKKGFIGIIWDDVWEILWNHFRMEQEDIKKIALQWVIDTYHLGYIDGISDLRNPDYIKSL
jgi:hypothetical protein